MLFIYYRAPMTQQETAKEKEEIDRERRTGREGEGE